MDSCKDCKWWWGSLDTYGRAPCTYLTGTNDNFYNEKSVLVCVDITVRTHGDFGCNQWEAKNE